MERANPQQKEYKKMTLIIKLFWDHAIVIKLVPIEKKKHLCAMIKIMSFRHFAEK